MARERMNEPEEQIQAQDLESSKDYVIVGTGKDYHMPLGEEYIEPGNMAELLINTGNATFKEEYIKPVSE